MFQKFNILKFISKVRINFFISGDKKSKKQF